MTTSTNTLVSTNSPQLNQQAAVPGVKRPIAKDWSGEHKTYNLLDDDNWQSWHDDINLTFRVIRLKGYISSNFKCLDPAVDPVGTDNWEYNNQYTQKIIRDRLSKGQKFHAANCKTSHEMWNSLQSIHQSCSDHTQNQLMQEILDTKAKDGDDIITHLTKIRQIWDCLTLLSDKMPITLENFKKFLAYSLPPSWNDFTQRFSQNPAKEHISISAYTGKCCKQYHLHQKRESKNSKSIAALTATTQSLITCISKGNQPSQNQNKQRNHCTNCGHNNHATDKCYWIGKTKCPTCKHFKHNQLNCHYKLNKRSHK
jgi:hypothetical protein